MVSCSRRDEPSRCSTSLSRPRRLRGGSCCLSAGTAPGKFGENCFLSSSNGRRVGKRASFYRECYRMHVFQQVYGCTVRGGFVFVAVPVWHVVFLPRGIPSADANGLMSMLMHFSLPTLFLHTRRPQTDSLCCPALSSLGVLIKIPACACKATYGNNGTGELAGRPPKLDPAPTWLSKIRPERSHHDWTSRRTGASTAEARVARATFGCRFLVRLQDTLF